MITQREFLERVVLWKIHDLAKYLSGASGFNRAKQFIREMQEAISIYGKTNKMDGIQLKAISMVVKAEKWLKMAFIDYKIKELRIKDTNISHNSAKAEARLEWEKYYGRNIRY